MSGRNNVDLPLPGGPATTTKRGGILYCFEISKGIRPHVFRQRLLEDPVTLFIQIAIALEIGNDRTFSLCVKRIPFLSKTRHLLGVFEINVCDGQVLCLHTALLLFQHRSGIFAQLALPATGCFLFCTFGQPMLPIARFGQNQLTANKGLSTQLRPDDASCRGQSMVQVTEF